MMNRKVTVSLPAITFYSFAALAVVIQFLLHQQAGLSFPIPWPDEVNFLWQAYAFCHDNALFSSVLNTDRTIMWMPPGYMLFVGMIFKVVGVSLEAARYISFAALCAFFLLLLRYLSDFGHKWFTLIFTTLFFLNGDFIACGNVARMEGILLVLVVGAYILIQQNRFLLALCLLALTPLIHFNGLFFCIGGAMYVWYRSNSENWKKQVNWFTIASALIVLGIWILYALFVFKNWDGFLSDMAFQFTRKGERHIWKVFTRREHITLSILLIVGGIYAYKSKLRALELLFLAVPAWVVWLFGQEMWYEVLRGIGYLCITLFAIHCWFHLATRDFLNRRPLLLTAASLVFLFYIVRGDYRSDQIPDIFHYPSDVQLSTMRFTGTVQYITAEDRAIVSTILTDFSKQGNGLSIEFEPIADAFLFLDLHEKKEIQLESPLFQERPTDLLIVHWSRRLPNWWKFNDKALERARLTKDSVNYIWHTRDNTEQWFFVPMSDKMRVLLPRSLGGFKKDF